MTSITCFVGDFALLGVVHVGVVDPMCVLFGLQHLISPHSQPVAELVLGKIRPSVVFSGAPETLANHSLPTGSISPRMFYICCLDWLYLPSVQQRRNCFLTTIFLASRKGTFLLCFTSSISFSFCKHRKILRAEWSCRQFAYLICFKQSSSKSGSFPLHMAYVCRPLQASLWCPYFWHLKHLRCTRTYCSTLSR